MGARSITQWCWATCERTELLAEAEELIDELMVWDDETQEPDLTQIEEIVLKLRACFGERLAETLLTQQEQRQPAERVYCPRCWGKKVNKGAKHNQVESRIGHLKNERDYYHCPACEQGFFPLDEQLKIWEKHWSEQVAKQASD
jgi:hypothetical protein